MRIYPVFIPHAGCPYHCIYCRQQVLCGQADPPTPDEVAAFLDGALPSRGDGEVAFFGGTFTLLDEGLRRAYLAVAGSFVEQGRVSGIRVSTRPDALGHSAVTALQNGKVTTVEIGCQSFSDAVLLRAARGHGSTDAGGAVGRLRGAGMTVGLQLMPGLPGGDRQEALFSLDAALALEPDFVRIYPTIVLSETLLEDAFRSGAYRPMDLDEAVDLGADMLMRCHRAGVTVIRHGLQASPELNDGSARVAGPYHPAFGQLVRSRLWLRALQRCGSTGDEHRAVVHPSDFSDARGHGNGNLALLKKRFGSFEIVSHRDVPRQQLLTDGRLLSLMDAVQ
jgi:histone acetyltransferase (RNA polymerase elongator complex component)